VIEYENSGKYNDSLCCGQLCWIDENLHTGVGWLRWLTLSLENLKAMVDALVIDNGLAYNVVNLSGKFNKQKFFDKNFYPVSLFYLGMTT
jgi:hypothetical protein